MNTRENIRDLGIIIILMSLMLLPFCNKPYHIDDPVLIYPARQTLISPLNPFNFNFNWHGIQENIWENTNPPFIVYYTGIIIRFFGEKEFWLHCSSLLFSFIVGISMYFLGKRFTQNAFLSTLFLIATPTFLVTSTGIMPDNALLAFYLVAIASWIYGVDKDKHFFMLTSGILIGFSSLTKYTGLTLIPLSLTYSFLKNRNITKSFLYMLIPLGIFALWCFHNIIFHGSIHLFHSTRWLYLDKDWLPKMALGTFNYIGGGTVFPLFIIFVLCNKWRSTIVFFAILLASLILFNQIRLIHHYSPSAIIFLACFSSIAMFLLYRVCERLIKEKFANTDNVFLCIWFFGILFFNIFLNVFAAVRFVLILTPPIILLLIRIMEDEFILTREKFIKFNILGILMTFIIAFSVAYADYIYARTYPRFVAENVVKLKNLGNDIWFSAHWGFQYYMEKEGYKCLSPRINNPQKGDILVIPAIASYDMPIDVSSKEQLESYLGRQIRLIESVEYNSRFPVRTMHKEVQAGFYSHGWGFLPFAFSRAYLERFYIWEFI